MRGGILFPAPLEKVGGFTFNFFEEFGHLFGSSGDPRAKEHHEFDVFVNGVFFLEKPPEPGDVTEEGDFANDFAFAFLDDTAEHDGLAAVDEEFGAEIPGIENGAAEKSSALADIGNKGDLGPNEKFPQFVVREVDLRLRSGPGR